MMFNNLSLIRPLLRAVADAGYTTPSPIQSKAIPPVLSGQDLLGCAQTGTGKTAAFALPILQLLNENAPGGKKRPIRSLILTPTRELALQIKESFDVYGKHLPLRAAVIFGGVGQAPQVAQIRNGIDILVATPGRLNDLIGQGIIKLDQVEIFVLDEADRMLDMGFVQDVKKVIRLLPAKRQTLLFSATMPDEIVLLADSLLHNPAKVFVTPASTTVEAIDQTLYKVDKGNKRHLLAQLLGGENVGSALVFTRTKHGADRVVRELSRAGIQAMAIHGNKSQNARQDALARFKDGRIGVMVATDIAARGLDISELSHVINYDLPNISETYVHRIGRTGRAGRGGIAISFCSADELPFLTDIEKLIGFSISEEKNHPWPMVEAPSDPAKKQNGRGGGAKSASPRAAGARQSTPKSAQVSVQKNAPVPNATRVPAQKAAPTKKPERAPAARRAPAETTTSKNRSAATAAPAKAPPARKPGNRGNNRRAPFDPYENLTGGKAIVTRRPVWGDTGGETPPESATPQQGETDMSRNNRRRSGKTRGPQSPAAAPARPEKKTPEIKKDEHGVFDFSESELAEDDAIKVISRSSGETKYANFEDFLKSH